MGALRTMPPNNPTTLNSYRQRTAAHAGSYEVPDGATGVDLVRQVLLTVDYLDLKPDLTILQILYFAFWTKGTVVSPKHFIAAA
jgi:hypothetical protein